MSSPIHTLLDPFGRSAAQGSVPWVAGKPRGTTRQRADGLIDSVQWIDIPGCPLLDLGPLERAYFAWVPRLTAELVRPRARGSTLVLGLEPFAWPPVIRLDEARSGETWRARSILGGILAHPGGEIAFEQTSLESGLRLVVAVRGLSRRLPRWLYFALQSRLHERSTRAFLRQVAAAVSST